MTRAACLILPSVRAPFFSFAQFEMSGLWSQVRLESTPPGNAVAVQGDLVPFSSRCPRQPYWCATSSLCFRGSSAAHSPWFAVAMWGVLVSVCSRCTRLPIGAPCRRFA